MHSNDVKDKLLLFFQNYILYNESVDEIDFDESLIDNGYVDSIGIITLVSFIEDTFAFKVHDQEILPENFDSLNNIINYISTKLAG